MSADPNLLSTALHRAAEDGAPPPSVEVLHSRLARRRQRRAALASGVTALGVVAVVGVSVLAGGDPAPEPPVLGAAGTWTALPPSPLGARHGSLAVTVGDEVLVLGGSTDRVCPPTAGCTGPAPEQQRRDGAAYDTGARTWRLLADAPLPPAGASAAVVGDVVHLLAGQRHAAYDVSQDRWTELPAPLQAPPAAVLVAAGDVLLADVREGAESLQRYDADAREWTELPPDPLRPSLDRQLLWTGSQVLLLGARLVPDPASREPLLQRAAVLDLDTLTWRRLPDATDTVAGVPWSWDGRRAVAATAYEVDGGAVGGYGRSYGTSGALDPVTGRWTALEGPAEELLSRTGTLFVGPDGVRWKTGGRALLDTATGTWHPVPDPPAEVGEDAAMAWVGDELVVWGGGTPFDGSGLTGLLATGAVYRP